MAQVVVLHRWPGWLVGFAVGGLSALFGTCAYGSFETYVLRGETVQTLQGLVDSAVEHEQKLTDALETCRELRGLYEDRLEACYQDLEGQAAELELDGALDDLEAELTFELCLGPPARAADPWGR